MMWLKALRVLFLRYKYLLLLFFLVGIPFSMSGQSYYFDNYSVEEGLAQSKIYTILQTSSHHIWVGTLSGASRFDGISFQNYSSAEGLAGNSVRAIYEDSYGNIWFGHNEGAITRYNGKKFETLPSNYLLSKDVTSISEDQKHRLWITSVGSGAVLISNPNAALDQLKFERYKGNRLSDLVFKCFKRKDGEMYFITDVGIKKYDPAKNSFSIFHPKDLPTYFQITSVCEDHAGNLWLGTQHGGLYKYMPKQDTVKIYDIRDGLSYNWISCLTEDRHGNIWAGTWGGGISVINSEGIKVFNSTNGLQDNNIWCLVEDVEGNILIGTTDHGLYIFKGSYMENFANEKSLVNKQVWSILEDFNKNMWFGTNGGLVLFNPNASGDSRFITYSSANTILADQIKFLKEDKSGTIWIGSENSGIFTFNPKSKTFSFPFVTMETNRVITAMELDQNNILWIGTTDGLDYVNLTTSGTGRLSNANGISGNDISALYVTSDNTLVVGSKGRGITLVKDTTFKKIPLDGNETPRCFAEDKNHVLWIGTESHGLLGMKDGEIIKRFEMHDGLLSNLVNLINCDLDGNIYVGSNKGMNKIDLATNKIYVYTKRNGFLGIETKNNATLRDSEGNIWFGTMNGVVKYLPKLDRPSNLQPLTHIYRFRANQIEYPLNEKIKLSYRENSIVIDFISICLTNPDAVQYQVKLEGIDADWQSVGNQTSVTYPALPAHKYIFRVRAKNAAGVWNTVPDFISFQIMPPFYKRWYFILTIIVLGIILIFLYIKVREQKLLTEKSLLEEKVAERTQEVVNMNEELAMKNKDIVDSIQYAKRIQLSVLPPAIPFENTFVLFQPKDIVSGDFFWFMQDGPYEWMAAVDCTGHGVPGAFMSLIGNNSLNKIVKEMGITRPSDILNQLDVEVINTLNQYGQLEEITDGMDIALIRYNKQTHELDYSGAFNPLWIVRERELLEIRADRFPIGRTPHAKKSFTNDSTILKPEDTIYLFTDGYADQFGGPDNKKYKIGNFKEFIINIQQYSLGKQKKMLEENIEKWRGNQVQIDDILVIGRKFRF